MEAVCVAVWDEEKDDDVRKEEGMMGKKICRVKKKRCGGGVSRWGGIYGRDEREC